MDIPDPIEFSNLISNIMTYYLFVDKMTGLQSVKEFDKSNFVFKDRERELECPVTKEEDPLTYSIFQLFAKESDSIFELNNDMYHAAQWREYVKHKVLDENPNYLPILGSTFPSDCFFYHEWDTLGIMYFRIDNNIQSHTLTLTYSITSNFEKIITCIFKQFHSDVNKFAAVETFPMSLDGWKNMLYRAMENSNNLVEIYNNLKPRTPFDYNTEISWDASWWGCFNY